MKNSFNKKMSALLSLVLTFALLLGAAPAAVFAASESDKLVDMFYDEIVNEYFDDVYTAVYNEAVKYGLLDDAIAEVDSMIADFEELKEQIPADIPEEVPEEIPEEIPEEWLDQIPQDILDKIQNGSADAEESVSDYAEYVEKVNQLRDEIDLVIETLNEMKGILQGDDLTTYEGLGESVDYLQTTVRERVNSIEVLWTLLAEDENNQIDPEKIIKALDILEDVKYALENTVPAAIETALRKAAAVVYDPACALLEIFLEKNVDTAEQVKESLEAIYNMSAEEREARIKEIIYEATHADYEIDDDSCYVAFGNISTRNSYVALLADKLDVKCIDNSNSNMTIAQMADQIDNYKADILKADLITINFNEVESVVDILNNVASTGAEYEIDWQKYLGTEFAATEKKIDATLEDLYAELAAQGVDEKSAEAFVAAVELYIYKYYVHAFNVHQVVTEINAINPDAVVVVVGTYNPLSDTTYTYKGTTIAVGSYLDCLFDAFGAFDLAYAIINADNIYVNAPDVDVLLADKELTVENAGKINELSLLPSADGHEYIKEQIWNALNITVNKETECEHNFGDWIETKAPTCTEAGEETQTCSICGQTKTRTVDALGHDWKVIKDTEATCEEPGVKTEKCQRCGEEKTETTDALGHDWYTVSIQDATCTEPGVKTEKCRRCGEEKTETIDPYGHDWHWIIDKEPTEKETGLKHEECSRCGEKRNENTVIPALGTPETGDVAVFATVSLLTIAMGAVIVVLVQKRKFFI